MQGHRRERSGLMSSCGLLNTRPNMPEILLGSHTVQTHGFKLAKSHKHDWAILILLAAVMMVLNVIHPFHRFVNKDIMTGLKYPLQSNTVPIWAAAIIAVLLPIVIFFCFYFHRRDVYDLHHAILGHLFSVLITGVITNAIKDAVGRPRPDFFWRCFPEGEEAYDNITGNVICNGVKDVIKEGYKSFPSGHTSLSFAGLCFLALYLSGKVKVFDRRGHVAKLCIVVFPLLVACLIGISRVDDYWHHWQDVFAGGLLGSVVATICYRQFFPSPYDSDGWGPYAYFQMLEESQSVASATLPRNQQARLPGSQHLTMIDEMESGRRPTN